MVSLPRTFIYLTAILSVALCLFTVPVALAFNLSDFRLETPAECQKYLSASSANCPPTLPQQISRSNPTQKISQFLWFEKKIQNLKKINELQIKSLAPLWRNLRDSAPLTEAQSKQVSSLRNTLRALKQVIDDTQVVQSRINICQTNCGRSRLVELNDEWDQLQKKKVALLINEPLLLDERFEKLLEKDYSETEFLKATELGLSDRLKNIDKLQGQIFNYEMNGKKPVPVRGSYDQAQVQEYLNTIPTRFPEVFTLAIEAISAAPLLHAPEETPYVCQFLDLNAQSRRKAGLQNLAIDSVLFAAPWVLGPLGRVSAWALTLAEKTRLAAWGIRALSSAKLEATVSALTNGTFIYKSADTARETNNRCERLSTLIMKEPTETLYNDLSDCRRTLNRQIVIAGVTTSVAIGTTGFNVIQAIQKGPYVGVTALPVEQNLQGALKNGWPEKTAAFEVINSATRKTTVMNLGTKEFSNNVKLQEAADDYWKFVGDTYGQRLNLQPAEIQAFVKTSQEMAPRTQLVIATKRTPYSMINEAQKPEFQGGVAVVTSRSISELLPLEKATGYNVDHSQGAVAEIVRLTVAKNENVTDLSKKLLTDAAILIKQDPSIKFIYIYTSKVHARLYKSLGLPLKTEKVLDSRDVILQMSVTDLPRSLNGR